MQNETITINNSCIWSLAGIPNDTKDMRVAFPSQTLG